MLLLPPVQLRPLLSLILNLLAVYSTSSTGASPTPTATSPSQPIVESLRDDHDVAEGIILGVLDLFGTVESGIWTCDVRRVVGEIGKGLVPLLPGKGKGLDAFMLEWKQAAGEEWEDVVDLSLLEVS
jgi:hypothetical protein